jgi:hypothetical protein
MNGWMDTERNEKSNSTRESINQSLSLSKWQPSQVVVDFLLFEFHHKHQYKTQRDVAVVTVGCSASCAEFCGFHSQR